jgi:cyanate lyase
MGGFLEKMGLKTKDEQARKISQDTGLSETYVRRLLEEPIRDVLTKPPPFNVLTPEQRGNVRG